MIKAKSPYLRKNAHVSKAASVISEDYEPLLSIMDSIKKPWSEGGDGTESLNH